MVARETKRRLGRTVMVGGGIKEKAKEKERHYTALRRNGCGIQETASGLQGWHEAPPLREHLGSSISFMY